MKIKTKHLIIIWLGLLTLAVFQNRSNTKWLEAQYDNVIEVLMTND